MTQATTETNTETRPFWVELWTADEAAECLPYHKFLKAEEARDLYKRLWDALDVEDWWSTLTTTEQSALVKAEHEEFGP